MSRERAHVYWNGTFSDDDKRALLNSPSQNTLPSTLHRILAPLHDALASANGSSSQSHGDDLNRYLHFDQSYYLPDDILNKSDRMSMAHSVEVRPAFLDHRIVEFAATLPAHLKISGATQKFLLKELMKEKLPPAILTRKKMGFDIPCTTGCAGRSVSYLLIPLKKDSPPIRTSFNPLQLKLFCSGIWRRRSMPGIIFGAY